MMEVLRKNKTFSVMLQTFTFKKLIEPVRDGIQDVESGLFIKLPHETLIEYRPAPVLKVFATDRNFITNFVFLHAWITKSGNPKLKKETHCSSLEWIQAMQYKQTNTFYWPPVQWGDIYEFKADLLLVLESFNNDYSGDIILEINKETNH
jgi:hypothetical protein